MFEIEKQSIKGKWCGLVLVDIDFKFIDRNFFPDDGFEFTQNNCMFTKLIC